MSLLCLDYIARIYHTLSVSLASIYFMRSDLGTFQGWPAGSSGFFLGNEFFGRLIWSPVSDLQLNLGGGLFVPALGDSNPDAQPQWAVELTATIAVF